MYYSKRKNIIKNLISIVIIILIALYATHHIYYKFKDVKNVDYSSKSLDIIFHSEDGDRVTLEKATPVTDAVGLSSNAYTLSIKNNLTEDVTYELKLHDDVEKTIEDNCLDNIIPKELIRVSIKKNNEKAKIFTLSELEDSNLDVEKMKALEKVDYSIRLWVATSQTPVAKDSHYHGIIKVVEKEVE